MDAIEQGRPSLGRGCTTRPDPKGIDMVCETFTGGTFIVSDFCGIFCKRLLHAGNETGRSRGKTEDEREEFPGECNIGLVEFDDGGEDDPFEDVDESSALDIL